MEIIVVDDHSIDDPEAVVRRFAGDRVRFVRQAENVGKVRNFETGLIASRGILIHQLHGDDRVGTGFYHSVSSAFDEFPTAGAFFCESRYIDESGRVTGRTGRELRETGIIPNWLEKIATSQRVQTPSIVVKRLAYEELGGFDRRLDMVEDWEMWIRIANRYPVGFVAETLADYRISTTGTSATEVRTGRIAARIRALIEIVDKYLPAEIVDRIKSRRNREMAQYITQLIPQLVKQKEYEAMIRACLDALRFSPAPKTVYRLFVNVSGFRRFVAE